jgi:hypothetical protein
VTEEAAMSPLHQAEPDLRQLADDSGRLHLLRLGEQPGRRELLALCERELRPACRPAPPRDACADCETVAHFLQELIQV